MITTTQKFNNLLPVLAAALGTGLRTHLTKIRFQRGVIMHRLICCSLMGLAGLASLSTSRAEMVFVQPSSISANVAHHTNTPAVLINAAHLSGGVNYIAPNPQSGGTPGPSSWWVPEDGSRIGGVKLSFDFSTTQNLRALYLWDYYYHTPTQWTLKLFSGGGGAGTELLSHMFSISANLVVSTSEKHVINFGSASGVLSGTLTSVNNSSRPGGGERPNGVGGTGLAEIGFTTVPEPSAFALLGLGAIGLIGYRVRRRKLTGVS